MLGDSHFHTIVAPKDPTLPQSQPPSSVDPDSPAHIKPTASSRRTSRKPGRPATYVFDKPDDQLTDKERKMKVSVEKRRLRQNRSYHRRKKVRKNPASDASHPSTTLQIPHATALHHVLSASVPTHAPWSLPIQPNSALNSASTPAASSLIVPSDPSLVVPSDPTLVASANLLPVTNLLSHPSNLPVPKLIPGFAQNPLDLLATATASGADPSGNVSSASMGTSSASAMDMTPSDALTSLANHPQSHPLPMPIEEPVEIDATAVRFGEISSFSLSLDTPKVEPDVKEEDATDVLVKSAMVAAKEYAKGPPNLKDVMDRETELRRMTGIKTIVFDNLRAKYTGMASVMQKALRHFIIFPRTFSLNAAAAIAGVDTNQLVGMQGMIDSMIQTNFVTASKGRYVLNEAARLFLNEDASVLSDNIANRTYQVAQKRFVNHYRDHLNKLQDDDIHKIGWLREQAMALYDCERENMEFSEYLLNGSNGELRQFLSAGITVMRYCVSASNRERVLLKALAEDETSTEEILLSVGNNSGTNNSGGPSSGSVCGSANTCINASASMSKTASTNISIIDGSISTFSESDNNMFNHDGNSNQTVSVKQFEKIDDRTNRARLYLALSEAYFDQLKMEEAERPLLEALTLMGDSPKSDASSASIVDSVLVLLLLSNLRLTAGRVRDARVLCVKALKILAEAGLGRSTFGINAMSNLVTIYLMEGHRDKAKSVASRLLDTLNTMRYTGMPIYADALGVCAMVSMSEGDYMEAEKQYGRALETVGKWGSKEWTGIPVQHCLDLDLWLMEGLAECIRRQGKIGDALVLEQRAAEDRESRGLPRSMAFAQFGDQQSGDSGIERRGNVGGDHKPPSLRHLY